MTKDTTVAEIAGRLTKAQRDSIMSFIMRGRGYFTANRTNGSKSLYALGLAETWGVSTLRLTPLGLAVRAHLASDGGGR